MTIKKKEVKDTKSEITEIISENKTFRNELMRRDQQINTLKEKLHEQNTEVTERNRKINKKVIKS